MKLKVDAIPSGTRGTIVSQDDIQGFVSVKFENGVTGNFGVGLVDSIVDSLVVELVTPAPDIMEGIQEVRTRDGKLDV